MEDQLTDRAQGVSSKLLAVALCAAGLALGAGSAAAARAVPNNSARTGCKPEARAIVRTLRLYGGRVNTVTADVGDTIKAIAYTPSGRVDAPEPLDHKHAFCRISVHRVSARKVIARFRARRAPNQEITFVSTGSTSSKGCPPHSHGCPHPIHRIGYVRIKSPARSFTG
jgi:hypothetical protein